MINYHEKSLVITYVQIYLKEYFGLTVKRYSKYKYDKIRKRRDLLSGYEITSNDPIKVTGYLTPQTYSSIALYIALNYPNEGFPYYWEETNNDVWEHRLTYNNKFIDPTDGKLKPLVYETYDQEKKTFISHEVEVPEQLKYYNETTARQRKNLQRYVEFNTMVSNEEDKSVLIDIISYNMENIVNNPNSISIPDRILSYILKEVVSPKSSVEEILRVKKMFYPTVSPKETPLDYDYKLFGNVVDQQVRFKNKYETDNHREYPLQYEYFHVTGYMDPWTEIITKGGVEIG